MPSFWLQPEHLSGQNSRETWSAETWFCSGVVMARTKNLHLFAFAVTSAVASAPRAILRIMILVHRYAVCISAL